MTFDLDQLTFDYDEEGDVLFIEVRGSEGRPAISFETDEGHVVRLDPETHELLGAEVLGYMTHWEGRDINLEWDVPESGGLLRRTRTRHERATVSAPASSF
jgi:hypothetical protein